MNDETNDIRERMQEVGRYVQTIIPPNTGFIVIAFDFGKGGTCEYVSNAVREDVIKLMKEFIAKTEGDAWMKHQKQ